MEDCCITIEDNCGENQHEEENHDKDDIEEYHHKADVEEDHHKDDVEEDKHSNWELCKEILLNLVSKST